MLCHITTSSNSAIIRHLIYDFGIKDITDSDLILSDDDTKIFVNGDYIGLTEYPYKLINEFRNHRRQGIFIVRFLGIFIGMKFKFLAMLEE